MMPSKVTLLAGQLCTVICGCITQIYTVLYYYYGDFVGYMYVRTHAHTHARARTHAHAHKMCKYRTIGVIGPPSPPVAAFIRGSTACEKLRVPCERIEHKVKIVASLLP
jgi:hypothetical protein